MCSSEIELYEDLNQAVYKVIYLFLGASDASGSAWRIMKKREQKKKRDIKRELIPLSLGSQTPQITAIVSVHQKRAYPTFLLF
jgi:hypothetical protein